MNRLIDDLMSLSRIELTEHQPPAGRVDLADARRQRGRRVRARRRGRGGDRPSTLRARRLPPVIADADQIAQVLQNLIDNALKYGREGGRVDVTLAPAPPGGRWPARPGVRADRRRRRAGHPQAPRAAAHRALLPGRHRPLPQGRAAPGWAWRSSSTSSTATAACSPSRARKAQGATFSVWLPAADQSPAPPRGRGTDGLISARRPARDMAGR